MVSAWVSHLQAMSQHNEQRGAERANNNNEESQHSLSPADSGDDTPGARVTVYLGLRSGSMGWNSLLSSCSWLLRLTRVTLPPWVMLVTHLGPPVRWLLLRLRGFTSLVLTGLETALLTDLVTPGPILTTLTLASLSRAACLSDARPLVAGLLSSSWWCCLFVVLVLVVCAGCSLPVLSWLPALAVSAPASSFRVLGGREGGPGVTPDSDTRPSSLGCLVIGLPWDPAAETRIQVTIGLNIIRQ